MTPIGPSGCEKSVIAETVIFPPQPPASAGAKEAGATTAAVFFTPGVASQTPSVLCVRFNVFPDLSGCCVADDEGMCGAARWAPVAMPGCCDAAGAGLQAQR